MLICVKPQFDFFYVSPLGLRAILILITEINLLLQFSLQCQEVISNYIAALLNWLKKTCATFASKSEVKPKPTMTRSHTLSQTLCKSYYFTLSFDWFIQLSVSFVIGLSDNFGLVLVLGHSIKNQFQG